MIEWMPRSRGDNGWSHLREGYSLRPAVLEDIDGAPVVRVPFLRSDVHDLAGLDEVGTHLFAS